jgi:hypothetical protein
MSSTMEVFLPAVVSLLSLNFVPFDPAVSLPQVNHKEIIQQKCKGIGKRIFIVMVFLLR